MTSQGREIVENTNICLIYSQEQRLIVYFETNVPERHALPSLVSRLQ